MEPHGKEVAATVTHEIWDADWIHEAGGFGNAVDSETVAGWICGKRRTNVPISPSDKQERSC